MSSKPDTDTPNSLDIDPARIADTGAEPDEDHSNWVGEQVGAALDRRKEHGDQDYKPWRGVLAKFGF